MALEEGDEFLFERLGAVMLGLILDVTLRVVDLRDANGKGAVALLPSEIVLVTELVMNPFRRGAFDKLHRRRDASC